MRNTKEGNSVKEQCEKENDLKEMLNEIESLPDFNRGRILGYIEGSRTLLHCTKSKKEKSAS